jgi:hypothetical protein
MMSVSINPYSDDSIYRTTHSSSSNKVNSESQQQRTASGSAEANEHKKPADSLQFSNELMDYLAGYTNSNASPTSNYGPDSGTGDNKITTEQMNAILLDLQTQLNSSSFDSNSSGTNQGQPQGLAEVLSSIKEELSTYDATTATEQETGDKFNKVIASLESARPVMQLQGQTPPKPTTDQMKTFLDNLQNKLGLIDPTALADTDSDLASKLASMKDELTNYDASSLNDDQVSKLFDEIMQDLHDLRPSESGDASGSSSESSSEPSNRKSGLPPMMKAMGSSFPPFSWNLNTSNSEQSDN